METVSKMKYSRTDRLVLGIGYAILGLFVLSIVVPLVYVVLASFMDPTVLNNQGLSFHIKDWTLDAYRRVLENGMIWRGFLNSFLYSLAFAAISVFVTLLAAYPMSKKEFVGRKFFNVIFLITMFFGGGMIPTFILINQLHMVNTVWAILIPGAFNVWNMILARTYYQSIPKELREASAIDGANEIQHFFQIMMPVCKPIIAVLALWSFVGMWNSYFDAMIYLNDANLQPLQLVLRSILVQNTPQPGMIADIQSTAEMAKVAEQLKYATIVVSSLPLLIMYPFFQKYGIGRYHQVSTDEVYGDLPLDRPDLFFHEDTPIHTSSPYSTSKASADLLVMAYHRTYGLPVTISRCSNNYGPYQFPEKLIPLMIANALADKPLPVYGEGLNVRDWLYVEDHCKAIDLILRNGTVGEVYNIGGHNEMKNIDIVKLICEYLGKPESLIEHVQDRKGHDMRYAIDPTKIHNELGWLPETMFKDGIRLTIQWYLDHKEWWENIVNGEYQNYYKEMYGKKGL